MKTSALTELVEWNHAQSNIHLRNSLDLSFSKQERRKFYFKGRQHARTASALLELVNLKAAS